MRGCNCGTVHEDAHAPGCSGFAVEYHRLTADNALLRADNARLREALEVALNHGWFGQHSSLCFSGEPYTGCTCPPWVQAARAALAGTSDKEGR